MGARFGARDDFAHCRFRDGSNGVPGCRKIEQESRQIADIPDHLKVDVNDVLVTGQHEAFVRTRTTADSNVLRVFSRDRKDFLLDDRPWCKIQTFRTGLIIFAEQEFDRLFGSVDAIE